VEKTVFIEASDTASARTKWKIKLYGSRGWKIVMQKDSIACLKNKVAGTLLISIDIPLNNFQPWRGWMPTSEIKIIDDDEKD
tara:strand:- start:326 stop:571 length:246 start_codon:yes stop_codon:yes gene_type:complete